MTHPATMTAIRLPEFGGPETLKAESIPIPVPRQDEILVRVHAAGINPVDRKMRDGKFALLTADALPITLGRDLAGVVAATGPGAAFTPGDRVLAYLGLDGFESDRGAWAGYAIVKAAELVAIPPAIDFATAAAIPLAALTAWQGLFDQGGVTAGQTVLIHGGAGGVGHLAVQIAKARGVTVIATASARDLDFVRDLGADRVIDYRADRFEDQVGDVDMVFDLIGGDTRARSWAVLRKGGILVSTLDAPDAAEAARHGVRTVPRWLVEPHAAQLAEIADLVASGEIRVTVAATFPLMQAAAAQDRQEHGHDRGKIVLIPA